MTNNPFTIRIFVPDGDPEGVRIIDRMNWTGHGIIFPREKWLSTRQRSEFLRTGLYILSGYNAKEPDLGHEPNRTWLAAILQILSPLCSLHVPVFSLIIML